MIPVPYKSQVKYVNVKFKKNYSFCKLTKFPISVGSAPEKRFPSRLLQISNVDNSL